MKPHEVLQQCQRYDERLRLFGPTTKALGWRDRWQQELRFAVLAEIGDLRGASVLDVGCGFGDLYRFLVGRDLTIQYTGVDINPNLLTIARQRNPQCVFEERNLLQNRYEAGQFDYVFGSGLFNAALENNESFAREMLVEMFRISRYGVSVNLMSTYVDYQEDHLHYYKPEEYFQLGRSMTKYVVLRHDYPLYEFTLYFLKNPFSPVSDTGEVAP